MGGVVKKVTRPIRKLIPKEIRPAVPFAAAYLAGPTLGAKMFGTTQAGLTASQLAQAKALTGALASTAQGDDTKSILRTAALSAVPDTLSAVSGPTGRNLLVQQSGERGITGILRDYAGKAAQLAKARPLSTIGAQSAIEGSAQLAEIQQDQIDAYNRQLQEQGLMDKTKRRQSIFNIYMNAGYDADYVNSVLDKYGYADGGIAYLANGGNPRAGRRSRGTPMMTSAMKKFYGIEDEEEEITLPKKKPEVIEIGEGEEIETDDKGNKIIRSRSDLATGLREAASGIEAAFGTPFGGVAPAEFKRFAKGGEVEEEEVSESGIMTVASAPNNFAELNMLAIDLFGRPYDQLSDGEQETLMDFVGSKSQAGGEGIMQMASGYKSDIEEMYEQYVFEMEEQGLQPMSFSEFLAQARSGMAKGGMTKGPDWFTNRVEQLMYQGLSYEEASEQAYNEGHGGYKDGGIMEKDMRGGGFIPEGSKERADDVPARLSKNEFVMTADAVRAAGGGSVNKGAKRMYDLMYTLEGKI